MLAATGAAGAAEVSFFLALALIWAKGGRGRYCGCKAGPNDCVRPVDAVKVFYQRELSN